MKKIFSHVKNNVQIYWHIFIFVALTVYIFLNWDQAICFIFFDVFNGVNLLFIVWLILGILPCIGRFEGFGIKMESPFNPQLTRKAENLTSLAREEEESTSKKNVTEKYIYDITKKMADINEKEGKK